VTPPFPAKQFRRGCDGYVERFNRAARFRPILEFPTRQIQRLPEAGGWKKVVASGHILEMSNHPERLLVLLIDFDGKDGRRDEVHAAIPKHLRDRVFVLGAWTEPEDLKRAKLGAYETIGQAMAQDCRHNTDKIWGHELLRHNAGELARLCERIRPILSN